MDEGPDTKKAPSGPFWYLAERGGLSDIQI